MLEPLLRAQFADQAGDRRIECERSRAAVRSIHAGRDEHQPEHPIRIPQGHVDRHRRPQRDPADDRLFDLEMIEERDQVVGERRDRQLVESPSGRVSPWPRTSKRDQADARGGPIEPRTAG